MGEEGGVRVHGWVSEIRDLGRIRFVVIRNWREKIQLTLKRGITPDDLFRITDNLTQESVIEAVGKEVAEKKAKAVDREVIPTNIVIHSIAHPKLPMDPNWKVRLLKTLP